MKCAIMQPTYLPWTGYFNLMISVDTFIFLDDVAFAKRSWQQRNKILLQGRENFLTVPVNTKGKQSQLICDVETDENQKWRYAHKSTLYHAYSKHPYGYEIVDLLSTILDKNIVSLAKINIEIIKAIKEKLGIKTNILLSSEIPVHGKKSEYLINLCKYIGAHQYLSALGSKEYIEQEGLFEKANIDVKYQDFLPREYPQKGTDTFIPYLSIIDTIANIGFSDTREYILS